MVNKCGDAVGGDIAVIGRIEFTLVAQCCIKMVVWIGNAHQCASQQNEKSIVIMHESIQ